MYFNRQDGEDPLGLAVKGRAREKRMSASLQGLTQAGGPLPDPNWDGYFEAVDEQAGGKPVRYGYADQPGSDLSRDPANIASQLDGMPMAETFNDPSNQLGTPYERQPLYDAQTSPALAALRKTLRRA